MGKLHTLRRAIERDPAKWRREGGGGGQVWSDADGGWMPVSRKVVACGAYRDSNGEWKPVRWGCRPWFSNVGSYRKFVEHVLRTLSGGR